MNRSYLAGSTDHAVVIGGSVAGALAARALSSRFQHVTVFDRDVVPDWPRARRGVPQGRHTHVLLTRGLSGLQRMFPGFSGELTAHGAPTADILSDFSWHIGGHTLASGESGLQNYGMSRPLVEMLIRQRVRDLPNVSFVDNTKVTGLLEDNGRVAGVRVLRQYRSTEEEVPAVVVVDAAGQNSNSDIWLRELNFPVPGRTVVRTKNVYVTRYYRSAPGLLDGRFGALVAPYPGHPRGGAVNRRENGGFMVMLTSMLDEDIPTDDVAMLEFGEGLPAREIAEVLRSAVPSNDAAKMRFPGSRLRHFESVGRHLEGFLVVGDALCSLNPVYGQGMTVAVMEAELLANLFENGGENDGRGDISARFQASAAALLAEPWAVSTGGDLRFDGVEVQGPWTPQSDEGSRYLDRLTAAAAVDPVLGSALLHVTNLVTPTASLFAPELEERVRAVTTQVRK